MILRDADGRGLGHLDTTTLVFRKYADEYSRQGIDPKGWAVEVGVIDTLFMLNCIEIQIDDNEAQTVYHIPFEIFTKNGVLVESDYGQKILVADEYWEVKKMEK